MLTPCFDVAQDDAFIIITMRVPYAKSAEAEFCIEGTFFKFYCKPYFLRLCLPGELVEDGRERAVHDINKGTIIVYVPKLHAGHHFENLGMITSLLSKKPSTKAPQKPLIEVLSGTGAEVEGPDVEDDEEFDWQIDQEVPVEEKPELLVGKHLSYYGFAEQQTAVFTKLQHELPALVDCPDPDNMTSRERRVARLAHEEASFNPEHYLADLMDGAEMIEALCQFQPAWTQQLQAWADKKAAEGATATTKSKGQREPDQDLIPFTDDEKMQLKELPNKEYLLDKATQRTLYLSLVDIIFAYAYDYRITESEHNVESAWNICKLSSTLSWLEVFRGSVEEVIYCCARRCLCYSLYRHWQLVQHVLQDTAQLFLLGRRKLLQCLLDVRRILNSSEPYYVMNNLYITDYCVWIQRASSRQIQNLAIELKQVKMEKRSMGWELDELEQAAHLVAAGDSEASSDESEQASSEEGEASSESGANSSSSDTETESSSGGETDTSVENNTTQSASDFNHKPTTVQDSTSSNGYDHHESFFSARALSADQGMKLEEIATVANQSPAASPDSGPSAVAEMSESKNDGQTPTLHKEHTPDPEHTTRSPSPLHHNISTTGQSVDGSPSPLHHNIFTTGQSVDGTVEKLSESLRNFLTLQPATPHSPTGPPAAGHSLIEELN